MNRILRKSKRLMAFLVLTVMILSVCIPTYAAPVTVSDIENHWAKLEITSWIQQGFITGYPDGTFKPNNNISRAEFISLVNRLFAFSEKATVSFTDVKESDWFYGELAKGEKAGYLSIYKGTIDANGLITRQEVAAIAAKVKSLQEDPAGADSFTDGVLIPAMFKGAIGAVAKAKVMNGYQDGKFEPAKNITRAESVVTLNRLFNLKNEAVKIEAIKDKSLAVGSILNVAVKVLPTDATLAVKSSDTSVLKATLIGTNVELKGLKVGTATVTLTGKKTGLPDGVATFKVEVVKVTSGGGGGGGSHNGGSNPPPVVTEDDNALTSVQAVGTVATEVSGKYANGVDKVMVLYGNVTKTASLKADGTFSWNIFPGLANGTDVTVKGYVGNNLADTDVVKVGVVVNKTYLSDITAIGTLATAVSGRYANGVDKVEVLYNSLTKTAALSPDGTFTWSIFPGLSGGTTVTIKGYVGTQLVETKTVVTAGTPQPGGPYITNLTAVGTLATAVSGHYATGVTKVEILYNDLTKTATLNPDGTFTWSIFPGLAGGTTVTAKAYVGAQLVETKSVVTAGGPVEGPMISEVTAIGTIATAVTGHYVTGVTKVEVLYNNLTKAATLNSDGTFTWSIFPGLAKGSAITVKSYVGDVLKDTVVVNVQ